MGLLPENIAVSTGKCSWLQCEADWTTTVLLGRGLLADMVGAVSGSCRRLSVLSVAERNR